MWRSRSHPLPQLHGPVLPHRQETSSYSSFTAPLSTLLAARPLLGPVIKTATEVRQVSKGWLRKAFWPSPESGLPAFALGAYTPATVCQPHSGPTCACSTHGLMHWSMCLHQGSGPYLPGAQSSCFNLAQGQRIYAVLPHSCQPA